MFIMKSVHETIYRPLYVMAKLKAKSFQITGKNLQMQMTISGMSLVLERGEKKTPIKMFYSSMNHRTVALKHRRELLS